MLKVPKYYRVKSQILELDRGLEPGSPVPTERDLAQQFGTSRTTVRQAIAELVVDGRLERTQGRGTFVAQPKLMQVRQLTSFSQDLQEEGWRPGSVILAIPSERPTTKWAVTWGSPPERASIASNGFELRATSR